MRQSVQDFISAPKYGINIKNLMKNIFFNKNKNKKVKNKKVKKLKKEKKNLLRKL